MKSVRHLPNLAMRVTTLTILFGVTAFAVSSVAATNAKAQDAAGASVDPAGTWRWEHDENGETIKNVLKLNYDKAANKVTGTYKGRIGPVKIENGKMTGDKLTFSMVIEADGSEIEIEADGTIKADELTGTAKMEVNGQSGEIPWTAKRSLQAEDVVGTWNLKLETPDGNTLTPSVKFSMDGDKLKADYTGLNGQFQAEAKGISVKDGKLMFTVGGERDGNSLTAEYSVTPRGDSLAGTIAYDVNGQTGELDVTGTRETEKE